MFLKLLLCNNLIFTNKIKNNCKAEDESGDNHHLFLIMKKTDFVIMKNSINNVTAEYSSASLAYIRHISCSCYLSDCRRQASPSQIC